MFLIFVLTLAKKTKLRQKFPKLWYVSKTLHQTQVEIDSDNLSGWANSTFVYSAECVAVVSICACNIVGWIWLARDNPKCNKGTWLSTYYIPKALSSPPRLSLPPPPPLSFLLSLFSPLSFRPTVLLLKRCRPRPGSIGSSSDVLVTM